jgi:hypothetical protein
METKHTSGPWVFIGECEPLGGNDSKRGSAFQVWEDMDDRGRVIAEVVSTEDESIGVTEGIANARLIAAAPELLEACKMQLAEITGGAEYPESLAGITGGLCEYRAHAADVLRAVIAKATTTPVHA